MEFKNKAPKWDAAGAEPTPELQTSGFVAGYKPPASYFNYLFYTYTKCINELQAFLKENEFLPISGGELTNELIVNENFQVRKTFDGIPYRSYVRPINYSVGSNGDYSTGLIHYKNGVNQAQLMFNKDGVMLRDNVNAKAYQLYGQHNKPTSDEVGAVSRKLLWENSKPTTSFAAQNISIPTLGDYDGFEIVYLADFLDYGYKSTGFIPYKEVGMYFSLDNIGTDGTPNLQKRAGYIASNGLQIKAGNYCNMGKTTMTESNTVCIPYRVYGVKGVL